jgi:D-glycerate 3-kinase
VGRAGQGGEAVTDDPGGAGGVAAARILDAVRPRLPARAGAGPPLVLGLAGAQGAGKSTVAAALVRRLAGAGRRAVVLSLDDLYLGRAARRALAAEVHPLLATRGVPGTHDVALGTRVLAALAAGAPVAVPRFDKAADEPRPPAAWDRVVGPVDVVVFEGWCVGARAQGAGVDGGRALARPVNALEAAEDPGGVWRRYVDAQLAGPYQALFRPVRFLAFLRAPAFDVVAGWRLEQERALAAAGRGAGPGVLDADGVARFVQHFERLTRHMLATVPARADLVLSLDGARRVTGGERP